MTTLFIRAKSNSHLLTLKVITKKEKLHPLIEEKEWKSTLISEEKICYLYVNKESLDYNFSSLYRYFVSFAKNSRESWNIDIQSFAGKNLSEKEVIQAVSEGTLFGMHQPINYKLNNAKIKKKLTDYYLITKVKEAQAVLDNSFVKLAAVNWARNFQDMPPNKLHAKEFAEQVQEKLGKFKNVEIEILSKKAIEKNKMGLLLAVNAGSHHEPRVVILRYFGDKSNNNILGLIGKGITFDSGGYNLKSSAALETMKFDMSGAAVVCASFLGLVQKKPKINVVAVACLTENAIGGHATLTESVITSMSGKTVEVNNTDAEGRLVLADGITYAIQKEKVSKIITVATLTGACILALGENTTGIMTNNREFYQKFVQATQKSHEKTWELPLLPENTKALKENTTIADLSNIAKVRYMGASSGAAFLQEFVNGLPFIHCDIAGTAAEVKTKRGTGVMAKTLIELFFSSSS